MKNVFFFVRITYLIRGKEKKCFFAFVEMKKSVFLLSREPQICFSWRFRFSFARGKKKKNTCFRHGFFSLFPVFFMRKLSFKRINMGFSFKNLDMRNPMVKTVQGLNTRLRDKTFVINKSSKKNSSWDKRHTCSALLLATWRGGRDLWKKYSIISDFEGSLARSFFLFPTVTCQPIFHVLIACSMSLSSLFCGGFFFFTLFFSLRLSLFFPSIFFGTSFFVCYTLTFFVSLPVFFRFTYFLRCTSVFSVCSLDFFCISLIICYTLALFFSLPFSFFSSCCFPFFSLWFPFQISLILPFFYSLHEKMLIMYFHKVKRV